MTDMISFGLVRSPDGMEVVEVNVGGKVFLPPRDKPYVGDGESADAALAIGEDAFRAGFDAALEFAHTQPFDMWASGLKGTPGAEIVKAAAWSAYEPPEDIRALA